LLEADEIKAAELNEAKNTIAKLEADLKAAKERVTVLESEELKRWSEISAKSADLVSSVATKEMLQLTEESLTEKLDKLYQIVSEHQRLELLVQPNHLSQSHPKLDRSTSSTHTVFGT